MKHVMGGLAVLIAVIFLCVSFMMPVSVSAQAAEGAAGGVAGGASTAARLRRLDESAEIIIFERGNDISFANCGIPYFTSGVIQDKKSFL